MTRGGKRDKAGRPKEESTKCPIAARVEPEMKTWIDQEAIRTGKKQSRIIEHALEVYRDHPENHLPGVFDQ
jgi:predicted DNA-binding protein